jgi:uncharacterized protein (DUF58 family)
MEPADTRLYRRFLFTSLALLALLGRWLHVSALTGLSLAFLAMLLRAWWLSRRGLAGLEARREVYPSAFEDDSVSVAVVLQNRSSRRAHLVEVTDSFGPGIADQQLMLEPGPLGAWRLRRLTYRALCSRHWGEYVVGPLRLGTSDPLGLYRARRMLLRVEPFAVFPRVHAMAGLERLGGRASLTPHEASAARSGQSLRYLGVRDYRPGDDLRRIHWPATARRGSPAVKEYETDLVPYFSLFLDLDRAHRAGTGRKSTLEYVVRTAASLLWSAVRRGDLIQVFAEGKHSLLVPPGRGEVHLTQCLYELIRLRQDGTTPILDLVERHLVLLPEGSTAAIFCGSIDVDLQQLEAAVLGLRARGVRPLLLFVNDASFAPVDRWPLSREGALERCREIEGLLREHSVAGAVLDAGRELEHDLARPDLFGGPD